MENKFSIIGCGRLGISLSVFLEQQGFVPVSFCSKSIESAQKAQKSTQGSGKVYENAAEAAKQCRLVFITTPDTIIEPVCEKISKAGGFSADSIVFHLSGALSSDILSSAKASGARTGSIHPLQAFAPYEPGQDSPFIGINMSIEGDEKAVALGKDIVKALQANPFTIPTDCKILYHASAVVASNYLVTLENFALELLMKAKLSEKQAYDIIEPLIQGTLTNIKARGSVDALTGPVARGDFEIVSSHIEGIGNQVPGFLKLYRLLGEYTLDITKQRGEISKEACYRLSELFKN
jgi:predicted short-subunit dehydrogenase-like oxidoreductase (DUF2520 family)